MPPFHTIDLGTSDYRQAYSIQRNTLLRRQLNEINDTLLLTEHKAVITMGRRGSIENLLADRAELERLGIDYIEVDRGGDITFHGRGQLVAYPIFNLINYGKDLHLYLRRLENVVIEFLSTYNISGLRFPGRTGVWVGGAKIASIGIGVKGWVSYHGLAINLNVDLSYFSLIRPCGIDGCEVTSLEALLGKEIDMALAKERLRNAFFDVFSDRKKDVAGVAEEAVFSNA